jgi:hypothetical protein
MENIKPKIKIIGKDEGRLEREEREFSTSGLDV